MSLIILYHSGLLLNKKKVCTLQIVLEDEVFLNQLRQLVCCSGKLHFSMTTTPKVPSKQVGIATTMRIVTSPSFN